MGKLDIGVGDDFPVDEPAPPSPEAQEAAKATREEWQRQKDEWRRRRNEWRAHRGAWKQDMRARRNAFKADVRKSFHEHFGSRGLGGIFPRVLLGFAVLALVIALLPFLFMFGFFALAVVLAFFALARGRRSDYPPGRPNAS
jgi:hypothetical protein